MGAKSSRYVPRYFKNFNIENRAAKKIQKIEKSEEIVMAPRHPSTAKLLKEMEEKVGDVDKVSSAHMDHLRKVKVYSKGDNVLETTEHIDRRPKKENEMRRWASQEVDIDYEKYGYRKPEKIPVGKITLRQFDELLNEYKDDKSQKKFDELAVKYKILPENLKLLIHYYKPFTRIVRKDETKDINDLKAIGSVFPNLIGTVDKSNKQK